MKKIISFALTIALSLGLCSCDDPYIKREYLDGTIIPIPNETMYVSGDPITLIYNELNPPDTIVGQLATEFKHQTEKRSGGKIKVELHYNGELGSEDESIEHLKKGDGIVDIARTSTLSTLDNNDSGRADILTLPFTFVNREHFWNFANSTLGQDFLDVAEASGSGVKALMFGEEGFRCFFSNQDITKASGMQGMNIRTYNKGVMGPFLQDLGAKPTDVEFAKVYSSIDDGTLDGAEQPITNYLSNKFYEVAPYLIMDKHTLGVFEICISESTWNSLTPSQQAVITAVIKDLSAYNQKISTSVEASTLNQLKLEGCTINELDDIDIWVQAAQNTTQTHIQGHEDDYNAIQEMKP